MSQYHIGHTILGVANALVMINLSIILIVSVLLVITAGFLFIFYYKINFLAIIAIVQTLQQIVMNVQVLLLLIELLILELINACVTIDILIMVFKIAILAIIVGNYLI